MLPTMQFAVGYQLAEPDEESFVDIVREFRPHIAEVYFAWVGHASGRRPVGAPGGRVDPTAQARLEEDLRALRAMGVRLDLLLNANCYGARALSKDLERDVRAVLERLAAQAGGADVVTTTSPAIAHMVGRIDSRIERRASVNMRIGTVEGMAYVAELYDSFHVQRDYNRDLDRLRELREWAEAHGKRLVLLANSGCLRFCSGQTFHDNLVAHEAAVAAQDNLEDFLPYVCWNLLKDRRHWPAVLGATWIRPEDLPHYAAGFPLVKLATRLHERPHAVIRAYAEGRYAGNLLDLMEPGFSPAFAPYAVDNTRFPPDWFARTSACHGACQRCGYCAEVLAEVLVKLG